MPVFPRLPSASRKDPHPMAFTSVLRRSLAILIFHLVTAFPASAQGSTEAEAFQEAERYYAAGIAENDRYEKGRYMNYAIGLYTSYLTKYSGSKNAPAVRFHLGYARQTLGRIDEAKNTYSYMIRRHEAGPYVGSAARQMAYLTFVEDDYEEAAKYFKIASKNLTEENLRYSALTKEVECLIKLDRKDEVSSALGRIMASERHPHRDWARFMLGFQYFEADRFETTITTLAPLLEPNNTSDYRSQALFYTGLSAAELGRDDVAESHLRTILEMPMNHPSLTPEQRKHLSSNKAKAQTSLMSLYTKKKDWDTVIELYEMGDFGATGKTEARRCMRAGRAYLIRQQYQNARACYRRVDRALPESETAFLASFKCLECDYYLNHPGLAERVEIFFEFYASKFSSHPFLDKARFFKGETLFSSGSSEKAAVVFNKIKRSRLSPSLQPELLFKHGWALSESGQFDGATRSFGHFLADFPDDPRRAEAHNKRAEAHIALGDYTSALRDFEDVLALTEDPEQLTFALQGSARVLREEKEYKGMIARYRRLLSEFPDLPQNTVANANYWIGWGHYKLEQFDEGPPYLRKARDMAPEFYSQPAGDLLILTAFNLRDKVALHVALTEVFAQAPAKSVPSHLLSWLGVQMFHDGQIAEAANYLARATDLKAPARTELGVWRILAKAQNRVGEFAEAQQTSILLLDQKQEPRWQADAYLDLAEARLGLRAFPQAIDAITQGLALNTPGPHVAGLRLVRGEVAALEQRWVDALAEFQATITMVPDDPVLQPRALYGAKLAAAQTGNDSLANDFANRLEADFSNWTPVIDLAPKVSEE